MMETKDEKKREKIMEERRGKMVESKTRGICFLFFVRVVPRDGASADGAHGGSSGGRGRGGKKSVTKGRALRLSGWMCGGVTGRRQQRKRMGKNEWEGEEYPKHTNPIPQASRCHATHP